MGIVYPSGVRTIVQQLRDAYAKTEWTMDELLAKSALELDRSSLRRKLLDVKDPIPMKTEEAEALARALGIPLVVVVDNQEVH